MAWILYHPPDEETGTELNPFLYCSPSPFWAGDSIFYFLSDGQSREVLGSYGSWFPPIELEPLTEYTWYAEHWSDVPALRSTSDTWSFTTSGVPEKPINPAPINTADDVILNRTTITWEDGGRATSYDVYYGNNAAEVAAADNTDETGIYLGNQAELSLTITGIDYGSPFEYLAARYWRIDAVNDIGTTTGNAWSFAAIAFDPPLPTGVTLDADGEPTGTPTGESGMLTVKRLVAVTNNKFWYEDI